MMNILLVCLIRLGDAMNKDCFTSFTENDDNDIELAIIFCFFSFRADGVGECTWTKNCVSAGGHDAKTFTLKLKKKKKESKKETLLLI